VDHPTIGPIYWDASDYGGPFCRGGLSFEFGFVAKAGRSWIEAGLNLPKVQLSSKLQQHRKEALDETTRIPGKIDPGAMS
jgi:hypothetical protein